MSTPQDPFAAPGAPQRSAQQPREQGAYGQPTYGQAPYGQPGQGQAPYGHPVYGQVPYGQAAPERLGWQGPPLAGWGTRVGSALLDALPALVLYLAGAGLGAAVGGTAGALLLALGYLAGFAFTLWNLVQQGSTGQTIGKRAVGTRLLREQDGRVVGAGLSIGRAFVHILDAYSCLIGYLWPLWDAKRQTFADKILKTVVIKV